MNYHNLIFLQFIKIMCNISITSAMLKCFLMCRNFTCLIKKVYYCHAYLTGIIFFFSRRCKSRYWKRRSAISCDKWTSWVKRILATTPCTGIAVSHSRNSAPLPREIWRILEVRLPETWEPCAAWWQETLGYRISL